MHSHMCEPGVIVTAAGPKAQRAVGFGGAVGLWGASGWVDSPVALADVMCLPGLLAAANGGACTDQWRAVLCVVAPTARRGGHPLVVPRLCGQMMAPASPACQSPLPPRVPTGQLTGPKLSLEPHTAGRSQEGHGLVLVERRGEDGDGRLRPFHQRQMPRRRDPSLQGPLPPGERAAGGTAPADPPPGDAPGLHDSPHPPAAAPRLRPHRPARRPDARHAHALRRQGACEPCVCGVAMQQSHHHCILISRECPSNTLTTTHAAGASPSVDRA